ncbi:hypothetical protein ACHAXR_013446 [Thalassiosira sp. AJA248-18]
MNNISDDSQGAPDAAQLTHQKGKPKSWTHTHVLPDGTRIIKTKRKQSLADGSLLTKTRTEKFAAAPSSKNAPSDGHVTTHIVKTRTHRINSGSGLSYTATTKEEMQEYPPVTFTKVLPDGSHIIQTKKVTASPVTTTTTVHLTNIPASSQHGHTEVALSNESQLHDDMGKLHVFEDDDAPIPIGALCEYSEEEMHRKLQIEKKQEKGVGKLYVPEDDEAPVPIGTLCDYSEDNKKHRKLQIEEKQEKEPTSQENREESGNNENEGTRFPWRKFRRPKAVARIPVDTELDENNERRPNADETAQILGFDEERLAVARPVDSSEDEPVYPATKYTPEVKTPFYKQRRYIVWTIVALLDLILLLFCHVSTSILNPLSHDKPFQSVVVAVTVVFATKEAVDDNPTPPLIISEREAAIKPYILSHVLQRNATWDSMAKDKDPRHLALNWILHQDKMQLERLDEKLSQRYILALLAFSFDSLAWKFCGNHISPGKKDYVVESCQVPDEAGRFEEHSVWLSNKDECDWWGVTCGNDRVTGLDMNDNTLIGEIPAEIAKLNLTLLSLKGNCLIGTLPPEIGNMESLQQLELEYNGLSGTFPDETSLTNLVKLNLAEQTLNDQTYTRSDGTVVNKMFVRGDEANGINLGLSGKILGSHIGRLASLKDISICGNSFSGSIASEIGSLNNLGARHFLSTKTTSSSLLCNDGSNTCLLGTSFDTTQTVFLNAGNNDFTGTIPQEITKLDGLRELWLGDDTSISGEIPFTIGDMNSLERLGLFTMYMEGKIPDSLYNLSNLKSLMLHDNIPGFEGYLKTDIGTLKKLSDLTINDNPLLTGTLPSELGLCEELEFLHLHNTQINGAIPSEVCALRGKKLFSDDELEQFFQADCSPDNITLEPFFTCDCCNTCCDHTTQVCILKT